MRIERGYDEDKESMVRAKWEDKGRVKFRECIARIKKKYVEDKERIWRG